MSSQSPSPTSSTPSAADPVIPERMRAVTCHRYGSPDEIAVEDGVPVPTPGEGEILIKMAAASLNALDRHLTVGSPWVVRVGSGFRSPRRLGPGADVAGTVVALGDGVGDLAIGDAVFGEVWGGTCAEYVIGKAAKLALKPDGVSWTDAAATPVAGLTALQGLCRHADLQAGERVLVNGAAGGVGTFAVQIAKAYGAHVTGVCSTRNLDMVRRLGADEVLDYTVDDVVERYGNDGPDTFDVIIDNVNTCSPSEILGLLKPGGRLAAIGSVDLSSTFSVATGPLVKYARFWRSGRSHHLVLARANREDLTTLGDLLADGSVVPEIQRTVGFDGVADGVRELCTGHARAKIVVVPDPAEIADTAAD